MYYLYILGNNLKENIFIELKNNCHFFTNKLEIIISGIKYIIIGNYFDDNSDNTINEITEKYKFITFINDW